MDKGLQQQWETERRKRIERMSAGEALGLTGQALMDFAGIPPICGGSTEIWDLKNNAILGLSLAPAARTASANGTGIDMALTEGPCFLIVVTGTITDGTHTVTAEESKNDNTADASGAADPYVAIAGVSVSIALTDDSVIKTPVTFVRTKRFVRGVTTVSGATTGGIYAVIVGGQKKLY